MFDRTVNFANFRPFSRRIVVVLSTVHAQPLAHRVVFDACVTRFTLSSYTNMERAEAALERFKVPGALTHLMEFAIGMEMSTFGVFFTITAGMVYQEPFPLDQIGQISTLALSMYNDENCKVEAHGSILPVTKGGESGIMLSVYQRENNILNQFWDARTKEFTYDE